MTIVCLRVGDELLAEIEARRGGLSRSEWIRDVLRRETRRDITAVTPQPSQEEPPVVGKGVFTPRPKRPRRRA